MRKDDELEWRAFKDAPPHDQQMINASKNTDALLAELRLIRWSLYILVFIALLAISRWWPEWWHTPWWP
jgi:hypothetical protein